MIDVKLKVAGMCTDHFAIGRLQTIGTSDADQRLRSGEKTWEKEEIGKAGDLSICKDRGLA